MGLTQLVATTSDPAVLRLVFFDLIDRYGQLGGSPWRKVDAILNNGFIQGLADSLGNDLLDLREPLKEWLLDSWTRVSDEAWEGVLSAEARAARRFTTSLPGESPTTLEGGQFVSKWLRAMRNTTHGYHLSYKMFERYLAHHEGVLPGAVRELAIALWLCFMSSPQLFWPRLERFGTLRRIEPPTSAEPTSATPHA